MTLRYLFSERYSLSRERSLSMLLSQRTLFSAKHLSMSMFLIAASSFAESSRRSINVCVYSDLYSASAGRTMSFFSQTWRLSVFTSLTLSAVRKQVVVTVESGKWSTETELPSAVSWDFLLNTPPAHSRLTCIGWPLTFFITERTTAVLFVAKQSSVVKWISLLLNSWMSFPGKYLAVWILRTRSNSLSLTLMIGCANVAAIQPLPVMTIGPMNEPQYS